MDIFQTWRSHFWLLFSWFGFFLINSKPPTFMSYCVSLQDCWIAVLYTPRLAAPLCGCALSHISAVKSPGGSCVPSSACWQPTHCSQLQPLAQMHRELLAPANSLQCATLMSLHVSISDLKQGSASSFKIHLACILSFRIRPFNSSPISISDSRTASDRSRILTKTGKP